MVGVCHALFFILSTSNKDQDGQNKNNDGNGSPDGKEAPDGKSGPDDKGGPGGNDTTKQDTSGGIEGLTT